MCGRQGWHEAYSDNLPLYEGLTLAQKCLLHAALVRDWQPTLGETLAKLTAEREMTRQTTAVLQPRARAYTPLTCDHRP